ncbi:DNA mismatch endonuclease Vsr [Patescibacteria group bacterium]|nr:DNA mismatch endonuclease Vsr [Patescibacteria group bacterium]
MRLIRGKNTKPEKVVRRMVSMRGFRYRLHAKRLPGRPDLAFPGRKKAIFVHGCFWHLHEGCRNNRPPKSRRSFWLPKLRGNHLRDAVKLRELRKMGWKALVIWECELAKPQRVQKRISRFLGN